MAAEAKSSVFRSDPMALCHMYLASDYAYECMSEIGELGQVQFKDLNAEVNAFQRKFVNEIRRCEEMERQLRWFMQAMEKESIKMPDYKDNPRAPPAKEMTDMEATFQKLEDELKEINTNSETLRQTFLELTEMKHILLKAQQFFDEKDESIANEETDVIVDPQIGASITFIAGVIYKSKVVNFEKMLWRICHGNVLLRHSEIEAKLEEPHSGDLIEKHAFIVFFQGEQLRSRIKKVCTAFHGTIYALPESQIERSKTFTDVLTRLQDLQTIRNQTFDHRNRVLVMAAGKVKTWLIKVRKIKAIYHALNMCNVDVTARCFIAECWCPIFDFDSIQQALLRGKERSGTNVPSILQRIESKEVPPTYNRGNKFTHGFQNLIDSYGVASYQEANPMPYTVITFPFLFAVMFGDAGHGLLMALFAAYLIIKEKQLIAMKIREEIFNTFFGGRYIILLMGLFSIYTGLIYNDVFSKSMNVFGSGWKVSCHGTVPECFEQTTLTMYPDQNFTGITYPFGIDPVWSISGNKIPFTNSYKMKMSIILGVFQMTFGVAVSLYNHIYFKNYLSICCEFIPQIIFLFSIFGYLVVTIFAKWITDYTHATGAAPSLLLMLINMFMFNHDKDFYEGEGTVEGILVVLAVICIPWMLLMKPLILRHRNNQQKRFDGVMDRAALISQKSDDVTEEDDNNDEQIQSDSSAQETQDTNKPAASQEHGHGHDGGEFDFGDTMVNQIIHTIEYCLGSVSHTASYLRLWALSLAHAQLSEVLWQRMFQAGLQMDSYAGAIGIYLFFAPWATFTVVILLIMEGLSAFLHALRLHWVEFQSKFYHGEGYPFEPFSLTKIMEEDV